MRCKLECKAKANHNSNNALGTNLFIDVYKQLPSVIISSKIQESVTVYKGDKKLAYETDATGAVGLGDASIFQSFMVCSEYNSTRTRLSFSKVAAGAKRFFLKMLFSKSIFKMRQLTRVQRSTLISKLTMRKTTSNLPSTHLEQEKEKFK